MSGAIGNDVDAAFDLLEEALEGIENAISGWGDFAEECGAYTALRAVRDAIAKIRQAGGAS